MIKNDSPWLSFVTLEVAAKRIKGRCEVFVDCWWIYDPEKGIVFWRNRVPQCSSDEKVALYLRERLYPWAEVIFLPLVFNRYSER